MADNEKEGEETSGRGNEWEVVSLTASTYAAAPGPKGIDSTGDDKDKELGENDEESTHAMFMSGHFVFPPSQHENLPLDPNASEILNIPGDEGEAPTKVYELNVDEGDRPDKIEEENWNVKGIPDADEMHGMQFFDEKAQRLSVHGSGFEEGKALQGLNLVEEEHSIYSASKFSTFPEANISGSALCDESTILPEQHDSSQLNLDSPSDLSKSPKPTEEDIYNESGLPCEAWWKRRAASLYNHAKEANTFWSVFVAAALMGLVILGQRWQQERWQIQQIKWQFCVNDEKINRMLGPISRFKDVLVGGHRRGSVIRGSASLDR
eukprot:TRINITY_DN1635_c0_g2_i2.p1 TRINITY_DN1635_c0_g2~~TRINITY_DN1635_c0_g2_i2.p1  ORF type:complete len:358 (-),score=93.70 TRINITY_DN1635_c0_g2_i2:466-1431(-)